MNAIKTSTRVFLYLPLLIAVSSVSIAQIQLLWTSPASVGFKLVLPDLTSGKVRYCFVVDTLTHQCKLYNADNFSLAYTISSVGAYEYPAFSLPDMNGNRHPEVFFPGPPARIVDASTGTAIYSWPSNYVYYGYFTTPNSNTIKIAFTTAGMFQTSSLVVYSLGITISTVSRSDDQLPPSQMKLEQNFPNPFNPTTTIEYSIPNSGFVTLEVFDISGRIVRTILSENQYHGKHIAIWDGRNDSGERVSSGTYFYVVKTENSTIARKMIYLK
jgi:hypothetical protein